MIKLPWIILLYALIHEVHWFMSLFLVTLEVSDAVRKDNLLTMLLDNTKTMLLEAIL